MSNRHPLDCEPRNRLEHPRKRRAREVAPTYRSVAVAGLLLVTACATSGVEHNEDGTVSIRCSGGYHDWSQCYERAEKVCGADDVDIVSRVSDEGSSGVGTRDWSPQGSEVSRTMVVRCR